MKNNSSEVHPGSLPQEVALKTKTNGCKSLRKIGAKSSSFNVTRFLDLSLITANKKEKFAFGNVFKSTFLLLTVKPDTGCKSSPVSYRSSGFLFCPV